MALRDKLATKDEVKRLTDMMFLVVIVLFIGFAGCFIAATALLVDSFREKAASYQQLELQVQQLDDKLNK